MPYTGNLLQLKQDPSARRLPGPSPRHQLDEMDPADARGEHEVPSGTGREFQRTDFPPTVMTGGGMRLDAPASWAGAPPGGIAETPYRITYPSGNPHDSDAVLSAAGSDIQSVATPLRDRAHDGIPDRGWWRTTFGPAPMFTDTQDRQQIDTDGFTNPFSGLADDGVKYVRGINSRPENNPPRVGYSPGFRPGRERVRVWGNSVFASVSREIGAQILRPRDAYTPLPYPRLVSTMVIPPAMPRDPGSPDDPLTARTNYASSPQSVFGGF